MMRREARTRVALGVFAVVLVSIIIGMIVFIVRCVHAVGAPASAGRQPAINSLTAPLAAPAGRSSRDDWESKKRPLRFYFLEKISVTIARTRGENEG